MKLMENRISQDAIIEDGEILKVGSFLNQQIDVPFISRCAEEFHRLFGEEGITRILTIEASGIGLACLCAVPFGVPVVFAKSPAPAISPGKFTRPRSFPSRTAPSTVS